MCGIAGYQGDFPAELLDRMSAAVAHRGPDGEGCVLLRRPTPRGTVGLAHRRLAIIDLSEEGRQPMTVRCHRCGSASLTDLALTYNGEIYNYRELRQELVGRGHVFHSSADSEVLLHLWADEGERMLPRLNGIFAFALYDGREAGRPAGVSQGDLFLARDPLGVKPLYLAEPAAGLLFASELKALLQDPSLPRRLDAIALHQHLAYLWTPAPRTLIEGVRKLPPGFAALARQGRIVREWAYYDLPYGKEPLAGSEDELAEELHRRLAVAVERQLVADVEVGAFLSGGLDSSAVVALMRRARPDQHPRCFSIGFEKNGSVDGSPADLPYARRVAAHLGVRLEEIVVTPGIIGELDRMLYHLDEPQADPAPINALLIAERAHRLGLKVLLSGAGGDDIFTGYRRHYALRLERMWSWLPQAVRGGLAGGMRRLGAGSGLLHHPAARRLVRLFEHADRSPDARLASYLWWSGEGVRRALYTPALAAAVGSEDAAAPLLASLGRIPSERDRLNRLLYLEGKHFLPDHNLNYTDKMGMASGVEVRVPLLDLDLVAFAARVPTRFKQRGRVGKAIFKRAMRPELPHDVIYRPKAGFGAPLRHWLRTDLAPRVREILSPEALAQRGLFDPAAVQRLIEADRAGRVDAAYTIFALMCVELWCQMFLDRIPSAIERSA